MPSTDERDNNVSDTGASTQTDDDASDIELVHSETRQKRDNHEKILRGLFGRIQQSQQGQSHHQDCSRNDAIDSNRTERTSSLEYDEEALSWTRAANNEDPPGADKEVSFMKDYKRCEGKKCQNNSHAVPIIHASIHAPNSPAYDLACRPNKGLNALENTIKEEDEHELFPRDSYSILALNGPTTHGWSWNKRLFCLFSFLTCAFQFGFLELLLFHMDLKHDIDDESHRKLELIIEEGADKSACYRNMRMAQAIALLTFVMFPNSMIKDLVIAVKLFPMDSKNVTGVPLGCTRISCMLRGIQSIFAIGVVFILVMSTENILEIILNFTAVNFITDLDDSAFKLARSGVFGPALRVETKRIENMKLPPCIHRKSTHFWYGSVMVATFVVLFGLMTSMIIAEEKTFEWIMAASEALKIVGAVFLTMYACFLCLHGMITRSSQAN